MSACGRRGGDAHPGIVTILEAQGRLVSVAADECKDRKFRLGNPCAQPAFSQVNGHCCALQTTLGAGEASVGEQAVSWRWRPVRTTEVEEDSERCLRAGGS
jgi:hypothetical protein